MVDVTGILIGLLGGGTIGVIFKSVYDRVNNIKMSVIKNINMSWMVG